MSETVINVTRVNNGHNGNHIDNNVNNLGWIKFNVEYFLTTDGILKLVQLVSIKQRIKCEAQIFPLLSLNLDRIEHLFAIILARLTPTSNASQSHLFFSYFSSSHTNFQCICEITLKCK